MSVQHEPVSILIVGLQLFGRDFERCGVRAQSAFLTMIRRNHGFLLTIRTELSTRAVTTLVPQFSYGWRQRRQIAALAGSILILAGTAATQVKDDQQWSGCFDPEVLATYMAEDSKNPMIFIPFQLVGGAILLPVCLEGDSGMRTQADFIIDTGSAVTIVDRNGTIPTRQGVKATGIGPLATPGGIIYQPVPFATVGFLRIRSFELKHPSVALWDMHPFWRIYGRLVGGILGRDFLGQYSLIINYPKQSVALVREQQSWEATEKVVDIPFETEDNLILISAKLPDGTKSKFVLDTGFTPAADALVYDDLSQHLEFEGSVMTENIKDLGGTADVRAGTLGWIEIGSFKLMYPRIYVHPVPTKPASDRIDKPYRAGLIGSHLLQKFIVEINASQKRLRLFRPEK